MNDIKANNEQTEDRVHFNLIKQSIQNHLTNISFK